MPLPESPVAEQAGDPVTRVPGEPPDCGAK
jgi:hypothetical protein